MNQSVPCSDETLGHLEEQILQQTRGLERRLLEEAAQKKGRSNAAGLPGLREYPAHARSRTHLSHSLRAGEDQAAARLVPAAPGLSDTGGASPSVQEMAALTVSKMPGQEAGAVIERLTGVKPRNPSRW